MKFDDLALPLTRGQLDIWLAQETGLLRLRSGSWVYLCGSTER